MALFENNQRVQELLLFLGDRLSKFNRKTAYWAGGGLVGLIVLFFALRMLFFNLFFGDYQPPAITYQPVQKVELIVVDQGIFKLTKGSYTGFVRIRNSNLDFGVASQDYEARFETLGGTVASEIWGKTFVLPASIKTIVFSRFSSDQEISKLNFQLKPSKFVHKPDSLPPIELEIGRVQIVQNGGEFRVLGVVKNLTAFTISEVYVPALLYNSQNQIVGANLTSINDVGSYESRSFQLFWPNPVLGVARAEISPEANIFERGILKGEAGSSPFENHPQPEDNFR